MPPQKREAKRRKAHDSHFRAERGCALFRSAPAFRRFTAAFITPMALLQNRVSSKHGERGVLPVRHTTL
jgi:hypothetical protein